MKNLNFISKLQIYQKKKYLDRMVNKKVLCMKEAKKYEFNYWDGNRKYGYGGYKYIEGRWAPVAKKLIKFYKLKNNSKVLDVGCGKGFLLYEIKKFYQILKFVVSIYQNTQLKIARKRKKNIFIHDVRRKFPLKQKTLI